MENYESDSSEISTEFGTPPIKITDSLKYKTKSHIEENQNHVNYSTIIEENLKSIPSVRINQKGR